MARQKFYNYFFLVLLLSCLYGMIELLSPFFGALIAAVFCGVIFYPLYEHLKKWLPQQKSSLHALLTEGIVVFFFVIPLFFLSWAVLQESMELKPEVAQWSSTLGQWKKGNVSADWPLLEKVQMLSTQTFGMRPAEFKAKIAERVNQLLDNVSLLGTEAATNIAGFAVGSMIMLFALFFVFRDGLKFLGYLQNLIPMQQLDKEKLVGTIQDTITGVARGLFFTSLTQGVLATTAYFIVGTDGAILLGLLTTVMGLVPIVGTLAVWVPVGTYYLMQGSILKGGFILLWGALVVVGFCDTILRPYLVGNRSKLHFFALFFGLLGGVKVWGAKGIILGPLIVSVVPVLLGIYQDRFLTQFESDGDAEKTNLEKVKEFASHLN